MKRIIRLTESDLTRIIKRVISENTQSTMATKMTNRDGNFCKGKDLEEYNELESRFGPMDGGCDYMGMDGSIIVAWPKGSRTGEGNWMVQSNRYIRDGKNYREVLAFVELGKEGSENLVKAFKDTDFFKNNERPDIGEGTEVVALKTYDPNESDFMEDLDEVINTLNNSQKTNESYIRRYRRY